MRMMMKKEGELLGILFLLLSFLYYSPCYGNSYDEIILKFKWKRPNDYYFRNIQEKLEVILHGKCLQNVAILPENSNIVPPIDKNKLNVIPYTVDPALVNWWLNIPPPRQMRIDPRICSSVYLKKKPIFDNPGCQLDGYMSPSAPRCQTKYLKYICESSRMNMTDWKPNHFILAESDHKKWLVPPSPWILIARDSVVSLCGHISSACGLIRSNANCKAHQYQLQSTTFQSKCTYPQISKFFTDVPRPSLNATTKCGKGTPWSDEVYYADRLFVVAEVDDTYIYHIHLEIVPRILYHLKFLQDNPDIKILIGCDTKNAKHITEAGLKTGFQQTMRIVSLFNISADRFIIHKHVFAREVYFPMEGGCQDPVYNTWQILHMRNLLFQRLQLQDRNLTELIPQKKKNKTDNAQATNNNHQNQNKYKKVMTILKRSSNSVHTRNKHDGVRQWNDAFANEIIKQLQFTFPDYEVNLLSDRHEKIMKCFECQVKEFARTDVLIGIHGAGLGMALYMPPNSAVIEIAPYINDGRCLLGGGPFSRLATVMGHNYMMHQPSYEEFKWKKDKTSEFNLTLFVIHTQSFLKSIDFA